MWVCVACEQQTCNKPAQSCNISGYIIGVPVYTIKRKDMGFIACKIKIPAIHHGQRGYN